MAEHAALARRCGVGKVVLCRNGDLVRLAPGDPGIIDEVPAGRLYKDGALLVDAAARTVADRRRLGFAGIVSVALALTTRGELVGDPEIELTGIPETDAAGNLIARTRLRRRAGGVRVDAAGAPARSRRGRGSRAPRGARRRRRGLEEEAHVPRPCADGITERNRRFALSYFRTENRIPLFLKML